MTHVLIALTLLAVLLLHGWLSRRRTPWAGAVMPVLWTVFVVVLFSQGGMSTVRDHLVPVLGLVVLLSVWAEGRERVSAATRPDPRESRLTDPVS